MNIDSFIYTNPGGREYNEDYVFKKDFSDGILFILADGLGGHQHGELASKCVAYTFLKAAEPSPDTDMEEWIRAGISRSNENLQVIQNKKACNMKTTAVVLSIRLSGACWAHVGDSRLYYFKKDRLETVTEDHSVAYKKYKAGEITKEQIASDEDQSSLLRTLGGKSCPVIDTDRAQSLDKGDAFLLCSDGLWEYVSDEEMYFDMLKSPNAQAWAELVLNRAIDRVRPGHDNLSLITVMID